MTVLHRQENAPTWHLRCDRCRHCTWHEDAASDPEAPHICSDCQSAWDEEERTRWLLRNSGPHTAHTDLDDLFGPGPEP